MAITGHTLLAALQALSASELDRKIYVWGCQQCTHGVVSIDKDDRVVGNDNPVIMLETED
jgi:hypothetical protein